jgi:hypothetical protein
MKLAAGRRKIMSRKGGFKNVKLGKNVYRQMKRRGPPAKAVRSQETEFKSQKKTAE